MNIGGTPIEVPGGVPTITGPQSLSHFIAVGINVFLVFLILLSFFYLVWGGFNWMQSAGDPKHLESARNKVIFSILGLILGFMAMLIVNAVTQMFGIKAF